MGLNITGSDHHCRRETHKAPNTETQGSPLDRIRSLLYNRKPYKNFITKAMKETSSLLQPVQRERHLLKAASEASR